MTDELLGEDTSSADAQIRFAMGRNVPSGNLDWTKIPKVNPHPCGLVVFFAGGLQAGVGEGPNHLNPS